MARGENLKKEAVSFTMGLDHSSEKQGKDYK